MGHPTNQDDLSTPIWGESLRGAPHSAGEAGGGARLSSFLDAASPRAGDGTALPGAAVLAVPSGTPASTAPGGVSVEVWRALERALVRAGRGDLASQVVPPLLVRLATMPQVLASGRPLGPSFVRSVTRELRACALDRARPFDPALLGELAPDARAKPASGLISAIAEAADSAIEEALSGLAGRGSGARSALTSAAEGARPKDELGTLREPLEGGAEAAGGGRVFMKGELHPGLLCDLVQLLAQNGETGRLFVERVAGSVFFANGEVIDAASSSALGEEAFYQVMQVKDGRFSYEKGVQATRRRIRRSAQHLIMETIRQMDEANG